MIVSTPSVPNCRSFWQIQIHSFYYVYRHSVYLGAQKKLCIQICRTTYNLERREYFIKYKKNSTQKSYMCLFFQICFSTYVKLSSFRLSRFRETLRIMLLQKSSQCKQRKRRQITDHVVLIFLVGLNNWKTNWTHPLDWLVY